MEVSDEMGFGVSPREGRGNDPRVSGRDAPDADTKRRSHVAVFDRPTHVGRKLPVHPLMLLLVLTLVILGIVTLARMF